tara:strand:+ start:187 stop:597 length:411 start_codon:yes stop_codon:yes gene_type:complete
MNNQEIELEKAMGRDVVIYVRFPSSVTDDDVYRMSEVMYEFCDMLGATVSDHFWEVADDYRSQHKLKKALKALQSTKYKELITYDLYSLTPDIRRSLELSESVMKDGGFIYYADEESMMMGCQALMNYNSDDDTIN